MTNSNYYNNKNTLVIGGSFGIGEELCKELFVPDESHTMMQSFDKL